MRGEGEFSYKNSIYPLLLLYILGEGLPDKADLEDR
jgi:hypothetical protein